jgi:hypothetical protein
VTLLARNAPRGVEASSLGVGERALTASERAETTDEGIEGLGERRRCWAARRGVMGCFWAAMRGRSGLVLSVGMALLLCEPGPQDHGVDAARLARRVLAGVRQQRDATGGAECRGGRTAGGGGVVGVSEETLMRSECVDLVADHAEDKRHQRRFLALLFSCSHTQATPSHMLAPHFTADVHQQTARRYLPSFALPSFCQPDAACTRRACMTCDAPLGLARTTPPPS